NTTLSLAVLRWRNGRKVPPQIQRMQAEAVLAAVFPDAAACFENIEGEREVPDHPLVNQTLRDCLEEAMDLPRLNAIVRRILAGGVRCIARDTPEPSPLCHELLNARPYAFLDDAPLEERRAQAVYTRRALEPSSSADLGALDIAAIERVRAEAWPAADSADELHDALLTCGFVRPGEAATLWRGWLDVLALAGRATRVTAGGAAWWVATERVGELRVVHPAASVEPAVEVPQSLRREWTREEAVRELLRGRMEVLGPTTAAALASSLSIDLADADAALLALEAEGCVLRGAFTPGASGREWCDRRLLARIHRYTLNRLRAEIQPVSAAGFMRFLFHWQRAEPDERAAGLEGLAAVVEQLDGFEVAAGAWEPHVLPARVRDYSPELLDMLCLTGRVGWGRLGGRSGANGTAAAPVRTTPLALFLRPNVRHWRALGSTERPPLSGTAQQLLEALEREGASFFHELVAAAGLPPTHTEQALAELVGAGIVTADSFAGLRALLTPSSKRSPLGNGIRRRRGRTSAYSVETAGRWSALPVVPEPDEQPRRGRAPSEAVQAQALALLRRWGIVFRKVVEREGAAAPWRELAMVYRRMEARGEVRGGRFVSGFAGEQFALPDAVGRLRNARKQPATGRIIAISAADPLNLTGLITPEARVPALARNRVLYRDGVPLAALEGGEVRRLAGAADVDDETIRVALGRRAASGTPSSPLDGRRAARRKSVAGSAEVRGPARALVHGAERTGD
ncbi:MAG: Lhr family helicase, partial [Longimicrobiales bacterium]